MADAGPGSARWPIGDLTVETNGLRASAARSRGGGSSGSDPVADALLQLGLDEVVRSAIEIEPRAAARGGTRGPGGERERTGGTVTVRVPPPPPGRAHVLLVDDEGAMRWVFADASAGAPRRGAPTETTFTFAVDDGADGASRGVVGRLIKKGLRVLAFDLFDKAVGDVADHFARKWEAGARPHRLRRFGPDDYRIADVPALDAAAFAALAGGPSLLFVHGTNSRSHSGFGAFDPAVIARLNERYEGRVFAFDHPTLSVDSAENCRWLAGALPRDAGLVVDVFAHSRGGLIGRVLAERPTDVGIDAAQLRVRQVVFVATPNRGTPLADPEQLGRMVDGLTNLIDLVPDNPASPVIDAVSGVIAVVKQLAVSAAEGLDGLVSMRPPEHDANGFLARLNKPCAHGVVYRAVAADYEPAPGSGLARIARDAAFDRVFGGEPNDLIVPTLSAYQWNGGTGFPVAQRVVLPSSRSVDHSSFWQANEVVAALDSWLRPDDAALARTSSVGADQLAGPSMVSGREPDPLADVDDRLAAGDLAGVRAAVAALPERERNALAAQVGEGVLDAFGRGSTQTKKGRVYVLPGIMGSLLSVRDGARDTDRIWVNPFRLLLGEFDRLRYPDAQVLVDGPYRVYLPLIMGLDRTWEVVPFGYDWRAPLEAAADRLAAVIDEHGAPAHLVAHSMGGLVCRLLRARHRATWDGLVSPTDTAAGGRLVMLGTPNLGSLSIASALTADDKMVRLLATVDVSNSAEEMQRIIRTFPGVYQLLPSPDVLVDGSQQHEMYDAAVWQKHPVDQAGLDGARAMHRALGDDGFDDERMFYVAGAGHDTPAKVRFGSGGFRYELTRAGDGRVTHTAGLALNARGTPALTHVWYSTASHGGLVKDRAVLAAVDELLATGRTARLPAEAPAATRGAPSAGGWVSGDELEPIAVLGLGALGEGLRGGDGGRDRRLRVARQAVDEATSSWLGTAPAAEPALPSLTLTVKHTSFEHAEHVVVLGHYAGTPLGGGELFADTLLGGQLAAHQVLGRYPSEPGDVLRISPEAGVRRHFKGVAVVGLGETGDLTPTGLARAMRAAALEHALREVTPAGAAVRDAPKAIGLSTVPVGSFGPDGLQLPTVVAALVEGVMLANRELAQLPNRPVCIDHLEIVELFASRAEEVTRVAGSIDRYLPASVRSDTVLVRPVRMLVGEGGRPGAPNAEYGDGMWRRLIVSGPDRTGAGDDGTAGTDTSSGRTPLSYTSLGGRARADLMPHVIDNDLVGTMVADAVRTPRSNEGVNVALFELLLPNDLKRELVSVENLVLVVDETTADIPWEALADRNALTGPEPLVTRMGLVRQLKLAERRPVEIAPVGRRALVIGNPPTGGLPPLPGARREATDVAGTLEGAGLAVKRLIYADDAPVDGAASEIVGSLLAADYQIVHVAGHGWFEPPTKQGRESKGGVVIGNGRYLTSLEIGQMRRPPSLVFLNCCHLGTVSTVLREVPDDERKRRERVQGVQLGLRPRLAASLSRTLMAMGVRAVVAAGWSVDDRAAAEFARVFYELMTDGEEFGQAVRDARLSAHQADGGSSNTWAAYQCYGDPGFRLGAPSGGRSIPPTFVSGDELVREIDRRRVEASDPGADLVWITAKMRTLEAMVTEHGWDQRGAVWSALGRAYGDCLELPDAIRCYNRALACGDAAGPVRDVEQLANLQVRRASDLDASMPGSVVVERVEGELSASKLRTSSGTFLRMLNALPETAERRWLRASFHKNEAAALAKAGADKRRKAALESARAYAECWYKDCERGGVLNALQLDAVLPGLLGADERAVLRAVIDGDEFLAAPTSYWGRAVVADLALTRALLDEAIGAPETLDALEVVYGDVFVERSAAKERNSSIRHVWDLARIAADPAVTAGLSDLVAALGRWQRVSDGG